ncbi:thylakoid membrane protein ThyD [Mastigocoleus testarum]|uniref:Multidrug MFS transporter n=1 Tax=Mastigocoleus testarum BC008 TaxID=371196 RepID=A0A0V7ZHD5_9CYAN|nr:TIGR01777 family oxidoreductase [Mastigocoleus testarum]KST63936.1 multidrug MFS transporter [Mastigocoleus testarum BC008]KST64646.1 multidrug MFS transporter [Mastigocoleus testarum BC008]
MKIAITGATGFVGSRLVERLISQGHELVVLSRSVQRAQKVFPTTAFKNLEIVGYTSTMSGDWQNAINGCDAVVNLAGEPIAEGRWTPERKNIILNSRKLGTQKIVEAIGNADSKPSVLVNASAIGYYGTSQTATFDETSSAGNDFLAQVTTEWESEAQKVKDLGVRLVILRFGIVLGMGGALGKMITPFKLFAGGPLGDGQQWFSWIHVDDLVGLILQALNNSQMEGVYNATSPEPVRMSQFCDTMGEVMNRPSWLPVPGFALEALLGEAATVVLQGQEVLPKRTLESGFEYKYPKLQPALRDILK